MGGLVVRYLAWYISEDRKMADHHAHVLYVDAYLDTGLINDYFPWSWSDSVLKDKHGDI